MTDSTHEIGGGGGNRTRSDTAKSLSILALAAGTALVLGCVATLPKERQTGERLEAFVERTVARCSRLAALACLDEAQLQGHARPALHELHEARARALHAARRIGMRRDHQRGHRMPRGAAVMGAAVQHPDYTSEVEP